MNKPLRKIIFIVKYLNQINRLYANFNLSDKHQRSMTERRHTFSDKFSNYIKNKVSNEKKQQLFGQQFSQSPSNRNSSTIFPFSSFNANSIQIPYNPNQDNSSTIILSSHNSSNVKKRVTILESQSGIKRNRLKKLKQLQQNVCAICLDQITKRCQLECKHKFCFDCLQTWFRSSNKCPFCRTQIHSFWYKGQQFIVEPKQFQPEDEEQEAQQSMDYICYNCQNTQEGDVVLICDRCQVNACHVECDQALHRRAPRGDWYCHFCR